MPIHHLQQVSENGGRAVIINHQEQCHRAGAPSKFCGIVKGIVRQILSVIKVTHSNTASPDVQGLHRASCCLVRSPWLLWQMGVVILDQCSLCLWSRSPLPLDLSLGDRACKEGAFMRANLHLHYCKLRPRNEASGETAAHCLQGQSWNKDGMRKGGHRQSQDIWLED